MRTTAGVPALLALVALVPTGCGGRYGAETSSADTTLHAATSDLGDVVVDADGRTVYVFDEDHPGSGRSACTADCLDTWPPVVADDEKPTADGVHGALGTIERDDGTLQVTLGGAPLYHFAGDGGPGDVGGQAVRGLWWAVRPDGQKITDVPDTAPDFSY